MKFSSAENALYNLLLNHMKDSSLIRGFFFFYLGQLAIVTITHFLIIPESFFLGIKLNT